MKKWKFWGKVKNVRKKIPVQNWLYGPPLLTSDHRGPTTTTIFFSPKAVSLGASAPYWPVDLAIFGDRGGGQNRAKNGLFWEKNFVPDFDRIFFSAPFWTHSYLMHFQPKSAKNRAKNGLFGDFFSKIVFRQN